MNVPSVLAVLAAPSVWIPVAESMPETLVPVIVYGILEGETQPDRHEAFRRYIGRDDPWRSVRTGDDGENLPIREVTHWMELPPAPAADPDNLPKPADLRRLRYQPHWSVQEMDAIDELSRLKDLEPVAIVRQALRHYQLAHADLKNPALAVNTVNTVNPVPAPETFEAHGHTWTRHTPGDPCPVPPDTLVHVLLRAELSDPVFCDPKGSKWSWAANIDDRTDEIIGWRYATPQPSTPAK